MNTIETNSSLCPIPGRYFGKPWRDLPDNALHYALAAANFGQPAAIADALSDAHLNALMDEIERRAGFTPAAPEPSPTSPAPTPAPAPEPPAPTPAPAPSAPHTDGAHLYCCIPGKHFGQPWADLPDAALDDALANVKPWKGYADPIGDRMVSAVLDAMDAHGHVAPKSGQPVPPYDWGKRRPGRPRTKPPKRKLTPEELSAARSAAGRKGAANSPASRPKPPEERARFQAVSIEVDVLEHLRSTSVLLHKPLSTTLDMALNSLDAVSYMTPECVRIFEDICAKTREEPDKLLKRILSEYRNGLG